MEPFCEAALKVGLVHEPLYGVPFLGNVHAIPHLRATFDYPGDDDS